MCSGALLPRRDLLLCSPSSSRSSLNAESSTSVRNLDQAHSMFDSSPGAGSRVEQSCRLECLGGGGSGQRVYGVQVQRGGAGSIVEGDADNQVVGEALALQAECLSQSTSVAHEAFVEKLLPAEVGYVEPVMGLPSGLNGVDGILTIGYLQIYSPSGVP